MRQLMESIKLITQSKTERHFESHIFFDGAIEDGKSSDFVLQLVELVLEIFGKKDLKTTF